MTSQRDQRDRFTTSIIFENKDFINNQLFFSSSSIFFIIEKIFNEDDQNQFIRFERDHRIMQKKQTSVIASNFTNHQINSMMRLINDNIDRKLKTLNQQLNVLIMIVNVLFSSINQIFFDFIDFIDFIDSNDFTDSISFFKQLRVENVSYFDFEYKHEKNISSAKIKQRYIFVVNVEKHVYYIEIYIFVDKLKNLIISHDETTIFEIFIFCFRDDALM